ncbi:MAG: hypothetical protein DRP92_06505, partial [Candidatus Neomarinimicrobiota bacterium]
MFKYNPCNLIEDAPGSFVCFLWECFNGVCLLFAFFIGRFKEGGVAGCRLVREGYPERLMRKFR